MRPFFVRLSFVMRLYRCVVVMLNDDVDDYITVHQSGVYNHIRRQDRQGSRLAKENSAFGRLYKKVWNQKYLKKGTKISVY